MNSAPKRTAPWKTASPSEVGLDPGRLSQACSAMQAAAGDRPYRVAVVRRGALVAEWNSGVDRDACLWLASATKSIFSSMLGIAISEGVIASADSRIIEYCPEAMDVPPGTGPKPGRHAFDKDREITFRQLISNTSGYMKPGEEPGHVFHYQTFGMNILVHAIAKAYGLYDARNPEGSPGLRRLIDSRLREPMHAKWDYYLTNFDHPPAARTHIWGYYEGVKATALDMARLGWMWLAGGRWHDRQLVPEDWLESATRTAPAIVANCPPEQWRYGYGFWTNDYGQLWPGLPRDSFAAAGAGSQHIWVCPSLELVVVQSPGLWETQEELDGGLLGAIACAAR